MTNWEWLDTLSNDEYYRVMDMIRCFLTLGISGDKALSYIRLMMESK